jgi:hypothetical protein
MGQRIFENIGTNNLEAQAPAASNHHRGPLFVRLEQHQTLQLGTDVLLTPTGEVEGNILSQVTLKPDSI